MQKIIYFIVDSNIVKFLNIMRADLHLHTYISVKNGDVIKWNSIYESLMKLKNYGIKMASFTDHNYFDCSLFLELKKLAITGGITLFPGIEVNVVKKNGKIGHMLILFDNDLPENDLQKIQQKSRLITKSGVSINEINNWMNEFATIRIIHIGKTDYFEIEDLDGLEYDAFEITNIDHPNYKKVLSANYKSSVVAFSDTHDWNNYPNQKKLITEFHGLKSPNFADLKELLKSNKDFFKNF